MFFKSFRTYFHPIFALQIILNLRFLQYRREKVENMKNRQKKFEEQKARRDYWLKQLPYLAGSAALVGFVSLIIYRYSSVGDSEL